jgi:hypothetical protein
VPAGSKSGLEAARTKPVQSKDVKLKAAKSPVQDTKLCCTTQFSPWSSFEFPELAPISLEQVEFVVTQFQACVVKIIQRSQVPFLHTSSHEADLPLVYQRLLGVSAMYCQRTSGSLRLLLGMLRSGIFDLVKASSAWSFQDLLLAVQALLVYEIIGLFDGDNELRAAAQRWLSLLEEWTNRLIRASTLYAQEQHQDDAFENWVAIESARRTVLCSVMVQAMHVLTTGRQCTSVPFMATLPVSSDGSLWSMSKDEWVDAAPSTQSSPITYREFVSEWASGKVFSIDTYETILLYACKHNADRMILPS